MLHARKDYNERIVDLDTVHGIPGNEPVFLLRAQDKHAPLVVEIYALLVNSDPEGNDCIHRNSIMHAKQMREWQNQHGKKAPDMIPEDSVY